MKDKCRCESETHGHPGDACDKVAVTEDHLCRECHDRAAQEAMGAHASLSEPVSHTLSVSTGAFALQGGEVTFTFGPSKAVLVSESLITAESKTSEGVLIKSNTQALFNLIKKLGEDWSVALQLDSRQWEELMAAAYYECGYDEVTLTPQTGDHGVDLIAVKRGYGAIRVLNQVKRYKPDLIVTAEQVTSLLGVLAGDRAASKAVLITTSSFAPRILENPAIRGAVDTRLELVDRDELQKRFPELAKGKKVF